MFPALRLSPSLASLVTVMLLWLSIGGCSSPPKQIIPKDDQLSRYVSDGREAYVEGQVQLAEKKYYQALLRAWAIDDPYESGTVAYNLAACLTSRGDLVEASEWLVDARVELCRAGTSTGNTWLLSAEIAIAQCRFEDAERFVDYAARVCPPCEIEDASCLCGPSEECCEQPCRDCCVVRLPCVGKKIEQQKDAQECRQGYQARIELARARLAAKQFDLSAAKQHLALACDLSEDACDLSLHADRHDVAALIHELEAGFLQAGAHRDREVRLLRCIGHYREIPNVLDAAADAYYSAERHDLAIDRMIRSARIHLARNQPQKAWDRIRLASELMPACECEAARIRLSLTAKLIRDSLDSVVQNEPHHATASTPSQIHSPETTPSRSDPVRGETSLREELIQYEAMELVPPDREQDGN